MFEDYSKFFKKTTGFTPYPHQQKVAESLLNQQNIILQAPTGSGKTLGTVIPFIYASESKLDFPRKLIYSLPLRVLVKTLSQDIGKVLKQRNLKEKYRIGVQTGEEPEDPKFLKEIVFTTLDQSLSSWLNIPVGLSKRTANLNAGAIISSYLIFDELHLFDPAKSLATTLELLKNQKCPWLIMTATMPRELVEYLVEELDAESVAVRGNDFSSIPAHASRRIDLQIKQGEINPTYIDAEHRDKTIVICNTVGRAQQLYSGITDRLSSSETEVILLHSRFLGRFRQKKEQKVKDLFGKGSNSDVILVATQVIEAGIDISCSVMHSELAPADSLIQRVGRCARYPGERGKFIVWDLNLTENEDAGMYAPYRKDLFLTTYQNLKNNPDLTAKDSERFLNSSLQEKYKSEIIPKIKSRDPQLIWKTQDYCEFSNYRRLIRDIASLRLIIHKNPQEIENPWEYESISTSPKQLAAYLDKIQTPYLDSTETWKIKKPFYDEREKRYSFKDLHIIGDYSTIYNEIAKELLLVINPKFAFHDVNLGFVLKENNTSQENFRKVKDFEREAQEYGYRKEGWLYHAKKAWRTANEATIPYPNNDSYPHTFRFIEETQFIKSRFPSVPPEIVDELIRFSIFLHDAGKLRNKWQKIAGQWQKDNRNQRRPKNSEFLAHTDYDPKTDESRPNFPPHAAVGALIVGRAIEKYFSQHSKINPRMAQLLTKILMTVIAKHHSPTVKSSGSYNRYRVSRNRKHKILQLVPELQRFQDMLLLETEREIDLPIIKISQLKNSKEREIYQLYQLTVRQIRLADQYSFYYSEKN